MSDDFLVGMSNIFRAVQSVEERKILRQIQVDAGQTRQGNLDALIVGI